MAKILFINEDKVDLNAEDLKSPSKTAGVAGVKKTGRFLNREQLRKHPKWVFSTLPAVKDRKSAVHCLAIAS